MVIGMGGGNWLFAKPAGPTEKESEKIIIVAGCVFVV